MWFYTVVCVASWWYCALPNNWNFEAPGGYDTEARCYEVAGTFAILRRRDADKFELRCEYRSIDRYAKRPVK